MGNLSDVIPELITHLSSDLALKGLVDSVSDSADYDKVPRGCRVHVRPVDGNANERMLINGRMRELLIGVVIISRYVRMQTSDTHVNAVIEALDKATQSFVSVSEHVSSRARFVAERDLADDYPEMRIEYVMVGYTTVETFTG